MKLKSENKTLIKQHIKIYGSHDIGQRCKTEPIRRIYWKSCRIDRMETGKFNDKWSFNSGYNSYIKVSRKRKEVAISNMIQSWKKEIKEINLCSKEVQWQNLKRKNVDDAIKEEIKYLKDIESEVADNEREIRSTVCVFVSFLGYKNWYYEGFPCCRKSAQSQSKSPNCEKLIN